MRRDKAQVNEKSSYFFNDFSLRTLIGGKSIYGRNRLSFTAGQSYLHRKFKVLTLGAAKTIKNSAVFEVTHRIQGGEVCDEERIKACQFHCNLRPLFPTIRWTDSLLMYWEKRVSSSE